MKARGISINENLLREPGIGPKLVLSEVELIERAGIRGVKIGKIFRQFSTKNADT